MGLKKGWLLASFLFLSSWPTWAQGPPRVELFGGYSYLRFKPAQASPGLNVNGWDAAITGNLNNWFGVVADFGGQYGSPSGIDRSAHSFLFGPRFSSRGHERWTPFAHALFGATRVHPSAVPLSEAEIGFGMALGGGVDLKVSSRVAVRLLQADYLLTRFDDPSGTACVAIFPPPPACLSPGPRNHNNARLAFGISFRFGGRERR